MTTLLGERRTAAAVALCLGLASCGGGDSSGSRSGIGAGPGLAAGGQYGGSSGQSAFGGSNPGSSGAAGFGVGGAGTLGNGGAVGVGGGGVGSGGVPAPGAGGAPMVPGSGGGGAAGSAGAGGPSGNTACGTLPPVDDYSVPGPFPNTTTTDGSGPDGTYTVIRPATLGENGFKHPIITWGNGITTTPANYPGLLGGIASHGFVIIASDSTNVTAALMTSGLDWLIQQNAAGGQFEGKLNVSCAATVGYSLGGGAAVGSGSHAGVLATVSFHGLQGPAAALQGPLLLFTSTADGFVTKAGYVQPCYDASTKVPTIMATLNVPGAASFAGHLYPLGDAGNERAPAIAWLRLWIYGDEGAKKYFYGTDCLLCKDPWTDIQRKNAAW